jgi:hypothetical protein
MTLPSYEESEKAFLRDMAIEFEFSGNTELAFVQRLLLANSDLDMWEKLANVLENNLIAGARNEEVNPVKNLRDRWDKTICPKLVEAGCPQLRGKGKWKEARKWLQEEKFPEWLLKQRHLIPLTSDQLWQQLWETATQTNQMRPVPLSSPSSLEMGEAEMADETFAFPLGNRIRFEVNLDSAGYLLLLEKTTSGKICCLSPSKGYAPDPYLPAGVASLPLLDARQEHFKLTGNPGIEEIVAVITKETLGLDWLVKPSEKLLELREGQLTELLEYLHYHRNCQVLRTAYRITLPY